MLENWNYARENSTIFFTQREMGVFAARQPRGVKTTKFNPCMDSSVFGQLKIQCDGSG